MARQKVGQILIQSLSLREARGGNFAAAGMAICYIAIAKHAGKLSYSSFAYLLMYLHTYFSANHKAFSSIFFFCLFVM